MAWLSLVLSCRWHWSWAERSLWLSMILMSWFVFRHFHCHYWSLKHLCFHQTMIHNIFIFGSFIFPWNMRWPMQWIDFCSGGLWICMLICVLSLNLFIKIMVSFIMYIRRPHSCDAYTAISDPHTGWAFAPILCSLPAGIQPGCTNLKVTTLTNDQFSDWHS